MTEPITALIQAHRRGDPDAVDRLYPLVQSELRRGAAALLRRERDAQSVQATELVNDALLRLLGATPDWQDRAHFLAVASRAMRQILVDRARAHRSQKRGGGSQRLTLCEPAAIGPTDATDLLDLDDLLTELAAKDERAARVVELRFFGGLEMQAVADALGISLTSAEREWRVARAWLGHKLRDGETA